MRHISSRNKQCLWNGFLQVTNALLISTQWAVVIHTTILFWNLHDLGSILLSITQSYHYHCRAQPHTTSAAPRRTRWTGLMHPRRAATTPTPRSAPHPHPPCWHTSLQLSPTHAPAKHMASGHTPGIRRHGADAVWWCCPPPWHPDKPIPSFARHLLRVIEVPAGQSS